MAGNSFGQQFVVTTCGESHGPAMMAIVDGCPPGIALSEQDFEYDIARRKTGASRFTSQRHEADQVEILSGVFEGETTGTPIGLLIRNTDQRSKDYEAIKRVLRPGHADYTYQAKYGRRDYRGGGRASARETVMRVAAGVIAKKILAEQGVSIRACVTAVGSIEAALCDWDNVEGNPFFFPDGEKIESIEHAITEARRDGDSLGARLFVEANGVPAGWGEPVFAKLSADLSAAMMGINAVKAVEIGDGFGVVSAKGKASRDVITPEGFESNHAGGILGGISNGQPITLSLAFKPTSSLTTPIDTITDDGEKTTAITKGRHDPCVGIRAVPIVEAMMAITLVDHYMRDRAQINRQSRS